MPSQIDPYINSLANWKVWQERFPTKTPSQVNSRLKESLQKLKTSRSNLAVLSASQPERLTATNCARDAKDFFEATRDLMRSFCVTARAYDVFSKLSAKHNLCKSLKSRLSDLHMNNIRDSLEASMRIYGDLASTLIK